MIIQRNLFIEILAALHRAGILKEIVLIGSWCHYFYKIYFNDSPKIPIVRTLDVDFLVPNPFKIQKEVNIPEILTKLDFTPSHSYITGLTKYVPPELELEFLTPERGRGKGSIPYNIPKLHINAQGLRYLNLLQSYTMEMKYLDMTIRIPEPAVYVLHKFIIFKIRNREAKKERDLFAAKDIGEFLLTIDSQKEKLYKIFNSLPFKWQRTILRNTKNYSKMIYDLLSDIKD